ncbi:hypothetical protein JKF63_06090 [Porcisia hertigi]|uniref:Uncharacterized protein n=1 Tax=Porcisia hertigi TaxID=2761500 RepID=A0A836I0D7_9TRYP|nr:hypothetical protein JKF63_06090 [Porcisia hertigi]
MNTIATERTAKTRQSVIDMGQRNQLETLQAEVRRNNEQLTSLRRENKELRLVLNQAIRGKRDVSSEDHYSKEEDLLHNKMCVLKRSLNAVKGKNAELLKWIDRTNEENRYIQMEGNGTLESDSSVAHKIRALENRLDKCLVKHSEVQTIRRTYETLLERLQLEQAGFNTQVSSTEQALQCANKDLGELVAVWKSAAKARDVAKAEVADLKAQLAAERLKQRKDLDERRTFIEEKRQQLEKKHETMLLKLRQQEERHTRTMQSAANVSSGSVRRRGQRSRTMSTTSITPEELEQIQRQKIAYIRLRDVTMGTSVTDVLMKLRERSDHHVQLQATAAELDASMQELEKEKKALQSEWEEVNHRAGHALVSARAMRTARDTHGAADEDTSRSVAVNRNDGAMDKNQNAATGAGGAEVGDFGLLADRRHERRIVVEEFRLHLQQRQDELEAAEEEHHQLAEILREVDLGVQYLAEKLSVPSALSITLNASTNAAVSPESFSQPGFRTTLVIDLLRNCGSKLRVMLEDLSPGELEAVARTMSEVKFLIPGTNVRIPDVLKAQRVHGLPLLTDGAAPSPVTMAPAGGHSLPAQRRSWGSNSDVQAACAAFSSTAPSASTAPSSEDYPENEIHDRQELKMMSMATVEREQQKARKRQMQLRRNKEEMA